MLKSDVQRQIVYHVLSQIPENQKRKDLMPILAQAYADMLWEEALTQQEREYYKRSPQDVNCTNDIPIFPYYMELSQYVCSDRIFSEEETGEAVGENFFRYQQPGRVNESSEYISHLLRQVGWEKFPTSLLSHSMPFYSSPDASGNPVAYIPDVHVGLRRDVEVGEEDPKAGERCPLRCYRINRRFSWLRSVENRVQGPKTEKFTECLKEYIKLGRVAMKKVYKLYQFLVLPDLTITALRVNFPELIKDVKF